MRMGDALWNVARVAGPAPMLLLGIGLLLIFALPVHAAFVGPYALDNFTLINTNADGTSMTADGGVTLLLTGGNNGSGLPGSTYFLVFAPESLSVSFHYLYTSLDDPLYDTVGYLAAGKFWPLSGESTEGNRILSVGAGEGFGFGIETQDNWGGPASITISDFQAQSSPEPSTATAILLALGSCAAWQVWRSRTGRRKNRSGICALAITCLGSLGLMGQQSTFYYRASDATGRLTRTAVINASQASANVRLQAMLSPKRLGPEIKAHIVQPQRQPSQRLSASRAPSAPGARSLHVIPAPISFSFLGLTHYDQRNANNGNQYSVEPPSPDIAVANGWILAGVNNAIQVYSTLGGALLGRALSTNELFGVTPAIDRATGINGVFPTDMRVFHDHDIDRWFVLQRAQDYNAEGYPVNSSHLYLAVSQTGDPTGNYSIYTMDTTNALRLGCPCFSDFPQIGADQYGIYISTDEYDTTYGRFADVSILAISKASLAAGSSAPRMQEFVIPRLTGYEATVRPAITPPGGSYALARGGIEFFLSTQSLSYSDNNFALWALTNTASLNTTPDLRLMQAIIPGISYSYPDVATQRPGPLPYGSSLTPPGQLAFIDGSRDSRVLSLAYVAGRLCVTFATSAQDETGQRLVAGGYAVLFPSLRDQTLSAPVAAQGYLVVKNNHILRPAVAITPQGRGLISFTIVGPDYYPSAAFVPVEAFKPVPTIVIAGFGTAPEDGFTGYPDTGFLSTGVARWGDYSSAIATADGSIWTTVEYIPDAPRTDFANWGTRIIRYPK